MQWYGEVASENGQPPQTQMGEGIFPTAATGGRMQGMCSYEAATASCKTFKVERFAVAPASATKYYGIKQASNSDMRYGGPGK